MVTGKKGGVGEGGGGGGAEGEEKQPKKNASFSAVHLSRTNVSCPFLAPSENRDLGEPTIHVFLYDNLRLTCRTGAILSCFLGQRRQAHGWVWSVRHATEGMPE